MRVTMKRRIIEWMCRHFEHKYRYKMTLEVGDIYQCKRCEVLIKEEDM